MSQQLSIELSDEVYSIIERQAREANTSPAQLASASLDQYFRVQQGTEHKRRGTRERARKNKAAIQAARERFEKHLAL
jgi:predicted transcriptional regulator